MLGCQQVGWLVGLSPWLIGPGERQHTAWRAVCVFLHRTVHVAASVAPRGVSLLSGWNPSRLLGVETTRPVISTCPFGMTRIRIAGDCVRAQEPAGSGVHSPVPWSNVASTVLARTRLDFQRLRRQRLWRNAMLFCRGCLTLGGCVLAGF